MTAYPLIQAEIHLAAIKGLASVSGVYALPRNTPTIAVTR